MFNRELKKGSPELLILALLEESDRHGYEIGKLIEARSGGRLHFRIGSLYPVLCRLEERKFIKGRWVEHGGGPRRLGRGRRSERVGGDREGDDRKQQRECQPHDGLLHCRFPEANRIKIGRIPQVRDRRRSQL